MSDASHSFFSSIKGSIKGKISRSASSSSQKSTRSARQTRGVNTNPFTPVPVPNCAVNEPPPAYTATAPATSSVPPAGPSYDPRAPSPTPSRLSHIQASTDEDQYAFLSSFDTIFLVDDSGSMAGRSWREVQSALGSITPICTAHDPDGIDLYFLNHRSPHPGEPGKAPGGFPSIRDASTVAQIFGTTARPGGTTPTGTRLNQILKAYLRSYEAAISSAGGDPDAASELCRPINVIVITDGIPSDDPESVLLSVAKRLDRLDAPPHQVGVQFFQVGDEPGAGEALRALDDDLARLGGGVRDMVDTVSFPPRRGGGAIPILSAEVILKAVLGAVVTRLDRARLAEEERRSMRSGMLMP